MTNVKIMHTVLIHLNFALFFSTAFGMCPYGWKYRDTSCYFLYDLKVDRLEAVTLCKSRSSFLVDYANRDEWEYLKSLLVMSSYQNEGAWTSLQFNGSDWSFDAPFRNTYKDLNNWYRSDSKSSSSTVPVENKTNAVIIQKGREIVLMPKSNTTLVYAFCKRSTDAIEFCDENSGWIRIGFLCVRINDPQEQDEALRLCAKYGGHLFLPRNPTDLKLLSQIMDVGKAFWVDGRRKGDYFKTKDLKNVRFIPWLNKTIDKSQSCLAVERTASSTGFLTLDCNEERKFVCANTFGTCPLDWLENPYETSDEKTCYGFHMRPKDKVTWPEAYDICKAQGGHLVLPSTTAKSLIYNVLQDNNIPSAWIGFNGTEHNLKDVVGKDLEGTIIEYDTTQSILGDFYCGATDYSPSRNDFFAQYCFIQNNFVCSIDIYTFPMRLKTETTICDDNWDGFKGNCFKTFLNSVTFDQAVKQCSDIGAVLVAPKNSMEQAFFSSVIFDRFARETFWIDIHYKSEAKIVDGSATGAYVTMNSNKASFYNFDMQQRYNDTSGLCVYVESGSLADFKGAWFKEKCTAQHNFVCQKKGSPGSQPDDLGVHWSPQCGPGWIYNNQTNTCYWVSLYQQESWMDARIYCTDRSSDLLSISNSVEQDFIENVLQSSEFRHISEPLWIGAGDKDENFGWTWSDSAPFSYLHWGEAEPRYQSDDGDNCGMIPISKAYEWESRPCAEKNLFICKKNGATRNQEPKNPNIPSGSCPEPLISGEHSIQYSGAFTASSYLDEQHKPENSRLIPSNTASWIPASNTADQWLQVTFASPVTMTKIEMRGDEVKGYHVTQFKMQYQLDDEPLPYWIMSKNGSTQIFDLGTGSDTTSVFNLNFVEAQTVRIVPVNWTQGISIKFEISGCVRDQCQPEFAMSGPLIIDDKSIAASSSVHKPYNARLHPIHEDGQIKPWINELKDNQPWIQVDLGKLRAIRGIKIVKGDNEDEYLTYFHLMFSSTNETGFKTYSQPYGTVYKFEGLSNYVDRKTIYLKSSIQAKLVRLVAIDFKGSANIYFDVLTCPLEYLSEAQLSGIPDTSITASHSSGKNDMYSASHSRISKSSVSYWKPGINFGANAYIQVDFGILVQVTAVATQGSLEKSWVRNYILEFSQDGKTFSPYPTSHAPVTFQGNFDDTTVVKNELSGMPAARFVRLKPLGYKKEIALRWEVYASPILSSEVLLGCFYDNPGDPDLPYSLSKNGYTGTMRPQACRMHCFQKGYLYAGIQNGDRCSCGNDYGRYGEATGCNQPCKEPFSSMICGGYQQNNVYTSGIGPMSRACVSQWSSYREYCYLVKPDQKTWFEANQTCNALNAQLVNINSQHENNYVMSLLSSSREPSKTWWIGLNDVMSTLDFQWSTKSVDVKFTYWDYHQPFVNPGLEQHNVAINAGTKGWTNIFGESQHGFVCKAPKRPSEFPRKETTDPGCLKGWRGFLDKCFMFQHHKATWFESQAWCRNASINSQLAIVTDQSYGVFLSSKLALMVGYYWTGVQDTQKNGLYVDVIGNDLTYTEWRSYKPDNDGRCVCLGTSDSAGKWSNAQCKDRWYFICEMPRNVSAPSAMPSTLSTPQTVPTSSTPNMSCPVNWIQTESYCYQYNAPGPKKRLPWHEARKSCIDMGADLASFHSDKDFIYLQREINKTGSQLNNYWIGLNNLNRNTGYEWSDNSVFNFVTWSTDQPNEDSTEAVCGEFEVETKKMALQDCNVLRDWVCGLKRGKNLTDIEPIDYPKANGTCGNDTWWRYKDYCYIFHTGNGGTEWAKTWRESRESCKKIGWELASIKTEDENNFIQGFMLQDIDIFGKVWIGLNALSRLYGYQWSDGSSPGKMGFNWNVNEPNDFRGSEACVGMLSRNGKWELEPCSTRQGFICKKLAKGAKVIPSIPVKPILKGNCPKGFQRLGQNCYILEGGARGQSRLIWEQARNACRKFKMLKNTDLASVTSMLENAFITTLLRESETSAWLGLKRISDSRQFLWTDNKELGFTAWNKEEPNMQKGKDACTYMYQPVSLAGRWNDVACNQKAAYVCQTTIDPSYPLPPFVIPSEKCQSYTGFTLHGNSCLRVSKVKMTWFDAQMNCTSFGAHLSSLMNAYDLAENIVLADLQKDSIWLGLSDLNKTGHYGWVSGYPVTFTRWAVHQPVDKINSSCIFLNAQGLMDKTRCSDMHHFICQIDVEEPQVTPKTTNGYCPHSSFIPSGSSCYKVMNEEKKTYSEAQKNCQKLGTTLASVSDDSVSFIVPDTDLFWIGLRDSINEGFSWEDGSPLANTYWAEDEPIRRGIDDSDKGCVAIDKTQRWFNENCQNKFGYICTEPKVGNSATTMTVPPTPALPGSPSTIPQKTPSSPTTQSITTTTASSSSSSQTTNGHTQKPKSTSILSTAILPQSRSSSQLSSTITSSVPVSPSMHSTMASTSHKPSPSVSSSLLVTTDTGTPNMRSLSSSNHPITLQKSTKPTTSVKSQTDMSSSSSSQTSGSGLPESKSNKSDDGLNNGEVAALVVGLLVLIALVSLSIFLGFKYRQKFSSSFLRRQASRIKNFESSLYEETHMENLNYDETPHNANMTGEEGAGKLSVTKSSPLGSAYRDLSVSFSTGSGSLTYSKLEDEDC